MLYRDQLSELVELLNRRNVNFYHSCQFIDFKSYLQIGGIPSRKKLTDCGYKFTAFETDDFDHENNVWDKVFLNFQDFGEIFEKGVGVPTVYGPIQLAVKPEALMKASDVAISLRSAGSPAFNRKIESLNTIEEVERLFRFSTDSNRFKRYKIKWTEELKTEFQREYVSNPEISVTFPDGFIPFSYIHEIKVDKYFFGGANLDDHVKKYTQISLWNRYPTHFKLRQYNGRPQTILNNIPNLLSKSPVSFTELKNHQNAYKTTKDWANIIEKKDLAIQWERYSNYFRNGTLLPILEEIENEKKGI